MAKLNLSKFDFSCKRVRYNGRVLDKCDLSYYIHCLSFAVRGFVGTLYTDIYWDSILYKDLVNELFKFYSLAMSGKLVYKSDIDFD